MKGYGGESMIEKVITRSEALLLLNDRCGQEVQVGVVVERGDSAASAVGAFGVLRHWQDRRQEERGSRQGQRDDIAGLYYVGDVASIDLSDLETTDGHILALPDEEPYGLAFRLGDGVELQIIWLDPP